jgi:putative endonuclease
MLLFARLAFAAVEFAARKGLAESVSVDAGPTSAKLQAVRTGVRGETYAYWYLRRHGYVLVAKNYTSSGLKGEIDIVGYDGSTLAFVEVKTRSAQATLPQTQTGMTRRMLAPQSRPEEAVNWEKRRNLKRMANQFLRTRHVDPASCRFDVLAIETESGVPPQVRLHKGAFHFGAD